MYEMIFKRKSFHLFRNLGEDRLTENDLLKIRHTYTELTSLYPEIRTAIRIVESSEKALGRGAEYAIEIYSEKKENYLLNAGYLGQALEHYLVSQNIGTLWFGIGKPEQDTIEDPTYQGMTFVIMILIAKVDDEKKFRKDMFKSKRKPIEQIWTGSPIAGVTDIARFAPSACNSQPWKVVHEDRTLTVYRYRKSGKVGIMPLLKVDYYNGIDMGIYLYILELCLEHEGYAYERELFIDSGTDQEMTQIARYQLEK